MLLGRLDDIDDYFSSLTNKTNRIAALFTFLV